MSSRPNAAVWLDHHDARIFHVDAEHFDESKLSAPGHHLHRHAKGATAEHHHHDDQHRFFHEVAQALGDAEQILVLGPSTAKLQLLRYLHQHAPALEAKVVGIETVDHPTDRQIAAYARQYFKVSPPRVP